MYCYVWEFIARAEYAPEFAEVYGPEGEWVQLFRRAPGYVRTELLRDREAPLRFVTVDYWHSRDAYRAFREEFDKEFEALDARCERLTERESKLGEFEIIG